MLLVRPNVVVGPGWEKICRQQREEWQDERAGNVLNMIKSAVTDLDKGKERDKDIVNMSENEINLNDKVILLVSRILNDKKSLPGYVYRGMIQEFRDRVKKDSIDKIEKNALLLQTATKKKLHIVSKFLMRLIYRRPFQQEGGKMCIL